MPSCVDANLPEPAKATWSSATVEEVSKAVGDPVVADKDGGATGNASNPDVVISLDLGGIGTAEQGKPEDRSWERELHFD